MPPRKAAFKIFFVYTQGRTCVTQPSGNGSTQASCPLPDSPAPSHLGQNPSWPHCVLVTSSHWLRSHKTGTCFLHLKHAMAKSTGSL